MSQEIIVELEKMNDRIGNRRTRIKEKHERKDRKERKNKKI